MRRNVSFTATLLASTALALPAFAQAVDDQATEEAERDEIVVTVERREQSLQDLAGTAVVLQGDDLKQLGVQNITDLEGRIPGVQFANNQGNIEVYIRGVGSSNTVT